MSDISLRILLLLCVLSFNQYLFAAANFQYPVGCLPTHIDETVILERVIDGDTLKLADGRNIRVIGINTPELTSRKKQSEPLSLAAKQMADDFFGEEKTILLRFDEGRYDRYQRTLAHVYRKDRKSLAIALLANGYGFHVAIPPNLHALNCLERAANMAKQQKIGVWIHPYFQYKAVNELNKLDTGFQLLRGRVLHVEKTKRNWWLYLDGPVAIKISRDHAKFFSNLDFRSLHNQTVFVKGWVVRSYSKLKNPREKSWIVTIHHPSEIEFSLPGK